MAKHSQTGGLIIPFWDVGVNAWGTVDPEEADFPLERKAVRVVNGNWVIGD